MIMLSSRPLLLEKSSHDSDMESKIKKKRGWKRLFHPQWYKR